MRLLIVMRGLPGSGKSTLAHQLQGEIEDSGHSAVTISTDDYWMEDGEYKFDITKLGKAHQWNLDRVNAAIDEYDCIVIDNTNIVWKDFKKYVKLAIQNDYMVMLAEPKTDWKHDIDECDEKNIHNVPKETIDKMFHKYQSNVEIMGHAKDMMNQLGIYIDIYEYDPLNLFQG